MSTALLYEDLVAIDYIEVFSFDDADHFARRNTDTPAPRYFTPALPENSKQNHRAILRTCKQIYREASELVYAPKSLCLLPLGRNHAPQRGRDVAYDLGRLRSIRRLDRLEVHITLGCCAVDEAILRSEVMIQQLRKDLAARTLIVGLERYGGHEGFKKLMRVAELWFKAVPFSSVAVRLQHDKVVKGEWKKEGDMECVDSNVPCVHYTPEDSENWRKY